MDSPTLTLSATSLSFPLAPIPTNATIRDTERSDDELVDPDALISAVVEDIEFEYALCGRMSGRIPGLDDEEEDLAESPFLYGDDRDNIFSPMHDAAMTETGEDDGLDYSRSSGPEGFQPLPSDIKSRYIKVRATAAMVEGNNSVFAQLLRHGLLSKLTQIVLLKAKVPYHLREEAAQEVQVTWSLLQANSSFARNQMARYAYLSGEHAALKVMRSLGAVVGLPSGLFSKKTKDAKGLNAKFLQYIGAATNPHDIEDYADSLEVSDALVDSWEREVVSLTFFTAQMQGITVKPNQRRIAELFLVDRLTVDDIAESMKLTVKYVERSMHIVADALNDRTEKQVKKKQTAELRRRNAIKKRSAQNGSELILFGEKAKALVEADTGLEQASRKRRESHNSEGAQDMDFIQGNMQLTEDDDGYVSDGVKARPVWDIAQSIPDMYEEAPLPDWEPEKRKPVRYTTDPAVLQMQEQYAADLVMFEDELISAAGLPELMSMSARVADSPSKGEIVLAVDHLAIDHFDLDFEDA